MRIATLFAMLAAASPALRAQDPADAAWQLTVRLSQVKRQIRKALENQPDYTCLATFDRYRWAINEGAERKIDTVKVEVAYVGGRELYAWPGEGRFSDVPLSRIVGIGMMGDGEFAVHAHNLFVGDAGVEKFIGEEQNIGQFGPKERKVWRWDFKISVYQAGWTVQHAEARQAVGSEGSFWVDPQTMDLLKMDTHATDFLAGFPLKAVASSVDYGRVRIGDQDVLLPLRAELKTTLQDGSASRNLTGYSGCRQYLGQSTISFGATAEPAAAPAPPNAEVVKGTLPAGLSLQIRLSDDVKLQQAVVGEAIEGTLAAAIHDGKKEIAPKGAAVHGRVRLITRDTTFTELGITFDEIEFTGHLDHFSAALKGFDSAVPGVRTTMVTKTTLTRTEMAPTRMDGASVFFIESGSPGLPKGTVMTWRTK